MRIPRYYIDQTLYEGETVDLPDTLHRHAIQVLRGKVGDQLILFNGQGGEYLATFSAVAKRASSVQVQSFDPVDRESSLDLQLNLALIKSDKFDFALQKAVEMGVNRFQPIITARTVINLKGNRLEKKHQHWLGIIHSACEQSGRTAIPELLPALSLDATLAQNDQRLTLVMLPEAKATLKSMARPEQAVTLVVGPEGGFNDSEVALMHSMQVQTVRFGPRIFRAETAAIAGLTLCQSLWGDLSN